MDKYHVTFFLHSIGLKFLDVEFDWFKKTENNRFEFSKLCGLFLFKSVFKTHQPYVIFLNKTRVVGF